MKKCTEFAFFLSAMLLALSLTILSPDSVAQNQMVLVTTGSTMPESLYVLWGDEYHKSHPETQVRYLAVGTRESASRILSGTGGDLGGGDAPIRATGPADRRAVASGRRRRRADRPFRRGGVGDAGRGLGGAGLGRHRSGIGCGRSASPASSRRS